MSLFNIENIEFYTQTNVPIIKGVSFDIEKGTTVQFDGKSGSGKSTLLKISAGIIVPTKGSVKFEGKDIHSMNSAQTKAFRKRTAFIFQDSALWANQNIMQNLMIPLQILYPEMPAKEKMETIKAICHTLNYERSLELRPADLSMGEQKKVAFARAMVLKPEILFLDEVTESLDVKVVDIVFQLLHDFIDNGGTVIYISHNPTFVKEFPARKIKIKEGIINEIQD
ncbi:MAG: ABC transporter ATP-binding protein [Treponema sp.]|nr:ABC transporter ATP-binding protein [Spirochaetia bacterium]MDD7460206.1 ABC transporter ATP-binding protein [Spirochaetales bacterium]MDY5810757.1 ABC transporter ATP-binding protein [Treponema sp.]MEE1181254.1 ABC transporter ATP-binding protein [Treponema sp.]